MVNQVRLAALLAPAMASAARIVARQDSGNTATVDFSQDHGTSEQYASGVLYGVPNTYNQIPSEFYTEMGYNFGRAGGGQLSEGGWVDGYAAYQARFASAKENYETAREYGGSFFLLPHDLWGTDHSNNSAYWPGDDGNWAPYDDFLNTVLSDLKSNNMLDAMIFDIWNEPNGGFWDRSEDQYLAMWDRTFYRIRNDTTLDGMLISGPSSAGGPGGDWWDSYLQNVVSSETIPDIYTWHDEPGDPESDYNTLQGLLSQYGAPQRPMNVNEYATYDQQVPAGAAWFISRFERLNIHGLRGNWLSDCQLYDFLASLLTKTDNNDCGGEGYQANGEWQVYKYYNMNMTGTRATTQGSGDGSLDVYATYKSPDNKARVLVGVINSQTGTWYVTLNNLSSLGLPTSGTLEIDTYAFHDCGHFCAMGDPVFLNTYGHEYSGDTVTFPIFMNSGQGVDTAFAFEFATAL